MILDLAAWSVLAGLVSLAVCVVVVLWLAGAALVRVTWERISRPP